MAKLPPPPVWQSSRQRWRVDPKLSFYCCLLEDSLRSREGKELMLVFLRTADRDTHSSINSGIWSLKKMLISSPKFLGEGAIFSRYSKNRIYLSISEASLTLESGVGINMGCPTGITEKSSFSIHWFMSLNSIWQHPLLLSLSLSKCKWMLGIQQKPILDLMTESKRIVAILEESEASFILWNISKLTTMWNPYLHMRADRIKYD